MLVILMNFALIFKLSATQVSYFGHWFAHIFRFPNASHLQHCLGSSNKYFLSNYNYLTKKKRSESQLLFQ